MIGTISHYTTIKSFGSGVIRRQPSSTNRENPYESSKSAPGEMALSARSGWYSSCTYSPVVTDPRVTKEPSYVVFACKRPGGRGRRADRMELRWIESVDSLEQPQSKRRDD